MQKYEIIEMGRKLYEKDLTFATSGNISIKTNRGIFITASGTALGNLKDCDFENCSANPADVSEDEYFANFRMYHCYLLNVKFFETDFSQLNKIDCYELKIEN